MDIIFSVIFGLIFIFTLIFIIIFYSYGSEKTSSLESELFIFRFVKGSSLLISDLLCQIFKKKKTSTTIKSISLIILTTMAISLIGLIYTLTSQNSDSEQIFSLKRPDSGTGDSTISLITDSELYSGEINLTINDREYTFEEAAALLEAYRPKLDKTVLGDNESFSNVTSPLTFPSSIGDEGISISWYIEDPDIIDYSGQPVNQNVPQKGASTKIVATMSLGDCETLVNYYITVYPVALSSKDILISKLTSLINSSENISDSKINLPSQIEDFSVSFYEKESVFPSMGIYDFIIYYSNFNYYS